MIALTDEMVDTYERAWLGSDDGHEVDIRRGLAAVLALIERDYPQLKPCPSGEDGRCLAIQYSASNVGLCCAHGCVYPGAVQ